MPTDWYVDSQEPIMTMDSEPEPDIPVIRGDTCQYADHHSGPEDVALVVEVADLTLKRDQGIKKRLYAAAGIPVYWIVNLIENRCEVYTISSGPTQDPAYRRRMDYGLPDTVPVVIEDIEVGEIGVRELFR